MIADARPLQPEFVPGDIVHRDHEVNTLSSALRPVTRGKPAEPAILYGPSGTGKTCIARYTLNRLREEVIDLNTQYVNCWEDYTEFKVLYRLLEGLDRAFDVHRQSTPTDELTDRLRDYASTPYVVILDEVDQLEDKDVLYDLYRTPNLELVLIANSEQALFTQLEERVTSRFKTAVRIQFNRYGNDALVDILQKRVRQGIRTDAIEERQVRAIAEAAAGDARVAIGILRAAAQMANRDRVGCITDEIIEEAMPEAKAEIRQKNVEKLTPDQQAVYAIIREQGEISPGKLYEVYEAEVEDSKSRRMVRNYLQKMRRYNLIEAEGEGRARTYSSVS